MKKLVKIYRQYRVNNQRLANITKRSENIRSALFALLLAVLCASIPVIVLIQLFIIPNIEVLLSSIILLIMMLTVLGYYLFYFKILRNYNNQITRINVKSIIFIETMLIDVIVLILGIVFIILLF